MVLTFHPLVRKWAQRAGSVCLSLAAIALFAAKRHQTSSSTPPDWMCGRKEAGSKGVMALSRFCVSRAMADRVANEGAESTTCSSVCDFPRTETLDFGGAL